MVTAGKKGYTLPAHELRQTPPSRPSRPTLTEEKSHHLITFHSFKTQISNIFKKGPAAGLKNVGLIKFVSSLGIPKVINGNRVWIIHL